MTVTITGTMRPHYAAVLTPDALAFVAELQRRFGARRAGTAGPAAQARKGERDAGKLPDFLPETAAIRAGDWKIRGIPADLQDRRVEITGPTDRKMLVNALNSGAKVFMADCEDALSPTWDNVVYRPGQPRQLLARPARLHRRDHRQALRGRVKAGRADHPAARLASR